MQTLAGRQTLASTKKPIPSTERSVINPKTDQSVLLKQKIKTMTLQSLSSSPSLSINPSLSSSKHLPKLSLTRRNSSQLKISLTANFQNLLIGETLMDMTLLQSLETRVTADLVTQSRSLRLWKHDSRLSTDSNLQCCLLKCLWLATTWTKVVMAAGHTSTCSLLRTAMLSAKNARHTCTKQRVRAASNTNNVNQSPKFSNLTWLEEAGAPLPKKRWWRKFCGMVLLTVTSKLLRCSVCTRKVFSLKKAWWA